MSYEHAVAATKSLASQNIGSFCVAGSLDAVLKHTDIDHSDYLESIKRSENEATLTDEEFNTLLNRPDYLDFHEYLASKYFPGKYILEDLTTSEWEINFDDDPFDPEVWQEFGAPQPKHYVFKDLIEHVIQKQQRQPDYEYGNMTLAALRTKIGTLIAIENAFDAGLTILGKRQHEDGDHVFGISKNGDAYFVYDSPESSIDISTPISSNGPLTVNELVGLPEERRPTGWPKLVKGRPKTFSFISDDMGHHYAIRLYPSE